MKRRALLATLAGGTAVVAGCSTDQSQTPTRREVFNPTGRAIIRPLDAPLVRQGLTDESGQYMYARLFEPGDSLPVTDGADASALAATVDDLTDQQFALLTSLRTAGAAPAHFWPTTAEWVDGQLRIELERQTISTDPEAAEVVGVALTGYDVTGEVPGGADVVFPGGAVMQVGVER
jgi:hypothetical protein